MTRSDVLQNPVLISKWKLDIKIKIKLSFQHNVEWINNNYAAIGIQ